MQCEIVKNFFELLSSITAQQKLPVEYVEGQPLYHAEMELLQQIYENPDANVSDLSRLSAVTKSAVTQTSAKLLSKGLIEKYSAEGNKKEKYFRLTDEGENMRLARIRYYSEAADEMKSYLCSLQGNDKLTIMNFMNKMKKCLPVCAFPCQCGTVTDACHKAEEEPC